MLMEKRQLLIVSVFLMLGLALVACSQSQDPQFAGEDSRLEVVATTSFIGDVVRQIAGDQPRITVLLDSGQNPHAYQPSPEDMVLISEADLVFANGFGLEEFLPDLLESTGNSQVLMEVSQGIEPLVAEEHDHQEDEHDGEDHGEDEHDGEDHGEDEHDGEDHGLENDPHVWFDPNNLLIWTDNIAAALAEVDPDNAATYRANASAYRAELQQLDDWIEEQVSDLPEQDRQLVTDHTSFGYFSEAYGFRQVGAVIPAVTTEAETSGRQLSELMETIRDNQVKAIFVSADLDPGLAEIVAEETGAKLVPLYFGSLTKGGPADDYLSFMRYNVEAIVSALAD